MSHFSFPFQFWHIFPFCFSGPVVKKSCIFPFQLGSKKYYGCYRYIDVMDKAEVILRHIQHLPILIQSIVLLCQHFYASGSNHPKPPPRGVGTKCPLLGTFLAFRCFVFLTRIELIKPEVSSQMTKLMQDVTRDKAEKDVWEVRWCFSQYIP